MVPHCVLRQVFFFLHYRWEVVGLRMGQRQVLIVCNLFGHQTMKAGGLGASPWYVRASVDDLQYPLPSKDER